MKIGLTCLSVFCSFCIAMPSALAAPPGPPEANGLTPLSPTIYVNPTSTINNGGSGSTGVAIADNGNVIVGWSDNSGEITLRGLQQATWTIYDSAGNLLIPVQALDVLLPDISAVLGASTINSSFLSFYRSDGTPTPNWTSWAPKIKANLFGSGVGMGAAGGYLMYEVPEFVDINMDDGPANVLGANANDFPVVQLLDNDGFKAADVLSGMNDADAQSAGAVRIGDWDYLSNGNILIVGESRQEADLVNRFGGAGPGQHVVFRIVQPDGTEVVPLTLASANAVPNSMWHGAGVIQGRFALRFDEGGAKVRIFNNDGTPVTGNLDLGVVAGNALIAEGGRGDSAGFHGNGVDAFVNVNSATDPSDGISKAYVTVLNAEGTLRYSRVVSDDVPLLGCSRVDGGIDASGRVVAVYEDAGGTTSGAKIIQGRVFKANGEPLGGTFYVSETETPTAAMLISERPRAVFRGNQVAVCWETFNNPADPLNRHVAARILRVNPSRDPEDNGVTPSSPTIYVNPASTINNNGAGSTGVAIADNGNVLIGWSDNSGEITLRGLQQAVWTLYDSSGDPLIPEQALDVLLPDIVGALGAASINSRFLSFYRSDGSTTPGWTSWAPKIKANLFGSGIGMGAAGGYLMYEVPELVDINMDDGPANVLGANANDFPAVQLLNNDGSKAADVLSGMTDADAQSAGAVRIGDWEYLSNGNILIVGESRQEADLVNRFGGAGPGQHVVFRIVQPDGTEVVPLTLVSENAVANSMWHGAGAIQDRFALRFDEAGAKVRIFNNDGTPVTGNLDLGAVATNPLIAGGGRGDSTGFHGNGVDAFINVNSALDPADSIQKAYVTVLNADGTLRYSRVVSDDVPLLGSSRVDGGIDASGRAVAVYEDAGGTASGAKIIWARLFKADGEPLGGTFYVSETETPTGAMLISERPRAVFRGNQVAVAWESFNNPADPINKHIAARIFNVAGATMTTLSIAKMGDNVVISWMGGGTLETATNVNGPWEAVPDGTSPYSTAIGAEITRFFRVR